jgi:hypothetical protein
MSDPRHSREEPENISPDEKLSVLFAQMIIQQSNLAMMLLGKMPHPQSGKPLHDIEGAKMFIDQMEMIEAKTKGNLSPEEEALLKQSLMSLRLAFVEAVESPAPSGSAPAPAATPPPESSPADSGTGVAPEGADPEAESRKKFSKKY